MPRTIHPGANIIIKFADDTVVVGLISEHNKTAYLEEKEVLSAWCRPEGHYTPLRLK